MRVKCKGGLNWQLPTAIRVKSKCGLTSRAGKMHVITVYIKGSGAQKQRLRKLLWTLWFDEKSIVLSKFPKLYYFEMY